MTTRLLKCRFLKSYYCHLIPPTVVAADAASRTLLGAEVAKDAALPNLLCLSEASVSGSLSSYLRFCVRCFNTLTAGQMERCSWYFAIWIFGVIEADISILHTVIRVITRGMK